MAAEEFEFLLNRLKALADDTRLKIVCLLSERATSVGDLADVLELTEPTVSHHLAALRETGLLNLEARGNKRFYKLNQPALDSVKRLLDPDALARHAERLLAGARLVDLYRQRANEERAASDAWLDALDLSEWDRKVLKDYTRVGQLTQIPTREKKLLVVLRWLAGMFEPGRHYTERDVNEVLKRIHPDYARLRRELVDFGFLQREGGGGKYWLAETLPDS